RFWWTDWPAFNRAVFDEDLERILRWYRARGYYEARITNVTFDPPESGDPTFEPKCDLENKVCPMRIVVSIDEGEPTLLKTVSFVGLDELSDELQEKIKALGQLELDIPIDEANYDSAKKLMFEALRDAGYAQPSVEGRVDIKTAAHTASVSYQLAPGAIYTFGELSLKGHGQLPADIIIAAASLRSEEHTSELQS